MKCIITLSSFLFFSLRIACQTPSDAILMLPREACILLGYDHSTFDQYWEGENLRRNETIGEVSRNTVLPMIAVGIIEGLNFYAGLPHVETKSSEPNGGKFAGADGFQDIILALKYQVLGKKVGKSDLAFLTAGGFSTPATNYLSDYLPYSLGFGADEWHLRGILQYQTASGFYTRASLAHLWRGYTKAERDYYYNNGSYYTAWMDVPNAWNFDLVLGKWFFDTTLKAEVSYTGLKSTSGDDIRKYNAAQPTNKVQFDQASISAQYYFPWVKGLGLLVFHRRIFNGRNMSKSNNIGLGLTYQFSVKKESKN